MIVDTLENLPKYIPLLSGLEEAVRCLASEDFMHKTAGSYTTADERCRYNIAEYETTAEGKRFEMHRIETDVQIMLSGSEIMEYALPLLCKNAGEYDCEKDICFADAEQAVRFTASQGCFVLFFTGEPHKPGLPLCSGSGKVKKLIFKIKN